MCAIYMIFNLRVRDFLFFFRFHSTCVLFFWGGEDGGGGVGWGMEGRGRVEVRVC